MRPAAGPSFTMSLLSSTNVWFALSVVFGSLVLYIIYDYWQSLKRRYSFLSMAPSATKAGFISLIMQLVHFLNNQDIPMYGIDLETNNVVNSETSCNYVATFHKFLPGYHVLYRRMHTLCLRFLMNILSRN